jgi:antitoxin HicB
MDRAKTTYLQKPYARIVIPTEPSGFHAEVLEFPGCFAQGDTVGEAYANLESAAESWIDSALALGQEIPEPSSNLAYSGRIVLRLPRSIHRQAAKLAEREQCSLNTFLVSAVANRVGAEDLYSVMAQKLDDHLTASFSNLAQHIFVLWQGGVAHTSAAKPTHRQFQITEKATTVSAGVALARK